jgi:hypothetical protein
MALYDINDRDNGLKVGDLITTLHAGYWTVTSIEQRAVTVVEERDSQGRHKAGDPINSIIHYELAFDSKFKPVVSKKKKCCDAYYCQKIDDKFITEQIKELNNQFDALCNFANSAHAKKTVETWPINLLSLGFWQSSFAAHKVGEWLTISGRRSSADATHSALLQRLFSGKKPLDKAPPIRMSCPCYELGEGEKIEISADPRDIIEVNGKVHLDQTGPFEWVNQKEGIVVYPPSGDHFKVWEEDNKRFIQKIDSK